jgi:DNA-binding transcriptional ArsR family regulator
MAYITPMDVFAALAEPHRRRIVEVLRGGERPAGDLVDALAISQPGVSKHLKALKAAGLVSARVDGQRRVYRLEAAALAGVDAWLAPYRRLWSGALDGLEQHLENEQ